MCRSALRCRCARSRIGGHQHWSALDSPWTHRVRFCRQRSCAPTLRPVAYQQRDETMKPIDIDTYSATDDAPHPDGTEPDWQESVLFTWFDERAGLGGFYRLGHEPQHRLGNCCFGVFSTSGERFRWNVSGAPLLCDDRAGTHMGLGPT